MHVSNLYRVPEAERLAERLVAASFADSVFFCNSGAEANEGHGQDDPPGQCRKRGHPERFRVICFDGAFHGRTLAMLAATGTPNTCKASARWWMGSTTSRSAHECRARRDRPRDRRHHRGADPGRGRRTPGQPAIPARPAGGLRRVRHPAGHGRGSNAAWAAPASCSPDEWAGITPDVMSAAKGIAGGFPMGAVLAREGRGEIPRCPAPMGRRFGGNPLACAAANAVLDVIPGAGLPGGGGPQGARAVA